MHSAPKRLSIALMVAVFILCFFRAATQSFTIDESFTFLRYVNVSFMEALSDYSANNHVLQSLLMRVFRRLLGRSELVMRLPALLGCLLFLTAAYRIVFSSIREGWLRPLALAAMTLNPLVLDLLVAARGYALALGLSWWALYFLWSDLDRGSSRRLWLGGVCAGLAVAANLVFVIPLAAAGLLSLPLYAKRQRFWDLIDSFAGPAIILCFVLLFIPLTKSAGQFYFGVASLKDTFGSLWYESLRNVPAASAGDAAVWLLVMMAAGASWLWFRSIRGADRERTLLMLVLGSIGCSAVCWIILNRLFGLVYPMSRTAVYVLPLAGFGLVLSASIFRWRPASWALAGLAAVLTILYTAQLRTGYFSEWRNEAGMKRLMRQLANDGRSIAAARPVIAGGTWDLEYTVRYYGVRYRLGWLRVLNSEERKSIQPDYYLLSFEERKLVDELKLTVVAKDDVSGTVLARLS